MKAAKQRRERLFRKGKPVIRPAVYADIRWLWAAARRRDFKGSAEEFTQHIEPALAGIDKLFIVEDRNREFAAGHGPVGVIMANYDGWTLAPHVEWFPWATHRNILRCTVGFLQAMRYSHDVGCIKIFARTEHAPWFRRMKQYVAISLAGRIPYGRDDGGECIFYLNGRKRQDGFKDIRHIRGADPAKLHHGLPEGAAPPSSNPEHTNRGRVDSGSNADARPGG